MKKILFFLFIALFPCVLTAQKYVKNFGKVDSDDFAETVYDNLGYDAVTLLKFRRSYFETYNGSLRFFSEYRFRVKVLKDGAFDGQTFEIPFSGRHEYEKVIAPKVCVYSQNGKKIVTGKLKFRDINYVDRDSLNSRVVIHLPHVRAGEILELRYFLLTFDFLLPPNFEFCGRFPCLKSVFVAEFPEHLRYKFDVFDDENYAYHSENQIFISIPYTFSPSDNPKSLSYMHGGGKYHLNFRFSAVADTFLLENVMPESECELRPRVVMKAYRFTQEIGNRQQVYFAGWQQMTHLLYVYAEPDNRYLSQSEAWFKLYNPGYFIVKADSWAYLHKRMRKSPDFWKPVMKSFQLDGTLQKIVNDAEFSDTLATVEKLYNVVNQRIEWDSTFQNHIDKSPEKTLKLQKGSSAEKNMTLVALLRRAGLDAFPALAATSDFGRIDTAYANRIQFNNILAVVRIGEKCIVMDSSEKNNPYNKLPLRNLNGCCWAVAPEGGFFIWF